MQPVDEPRGRLEALVRTCGRRAWAVASALLRDGHEAHDAVQQALLVAARKVDRIPADDPWPWFGVVVGHEARNLRRKRRPTPSGSLLETDAPMTSRPPPDVDPGRASARRDDDRRVQAALDALPREQREAVALVHLAGMTQTAAAEALDVPRQTLTTRLHRGLAGLEQQLGRGRASVAGSLALLPLGAPPLGWDVALAEWSRTAIAALAAPTATTTTTLLGGLTLMSTKTMLALSLTAALGVGFLGGHLASPHLLDGGPVASPADAALAPQGADAIGSGTPSNSTPTLDPGAEARVAELVRLRQEGERLRARLAEATRRGDELARELAASTGDAGPTFTFGKAGTLAAIREADWGEMATASVVVADSVHDVLRRKEAGEPVPKETLLALQENVERMRKYEYRTIGKLPTDAKHNGELTHPITVANLFAAMLAEAGHPLTDGQIQRIDALGRRFERDFTKQRELSARYRTRVERILAEYRLKGRFMEDLAAVLDAEQQGVVYDPATRGLAGLDLHDPTLMILHSSPVLAGANLDEIVAKLADLLAGKLGLDADGRRGLGNALEAWRGDVASLLRPVEPLRVKHYSYADGELAGQAAVNLVARLLADLDLSDETRAALREDPAIYVPRIVAKTG